MASATSHSLAKRPVPAPSNPVLLSSQLQWLFTDEELTRTPSQLDGMKMEAEHTSRSKGVNFITQVGIMLKLPQPTLATAAVYLHRFFMRYSIVDLPQRPGMHPYPIAATALFLATKVEENVRRMKELVVACCRVAQKQPNLVVDEQSKEFWKWRDTILHHEDILLEALCFDLQLEQPYRILYDFICFFSVNENKPLRNAAWAFVNDSMFTVLCLQFSARTIAAAALYAAARHCDVGFEDDSLGRPWWEQIDVDLTQVRRACTRIAHLYENNTMQKHSQYYPTTPIVSDEGNEKTRIPLAGSPAGHAPSGEADVNGRKRSREPEDNEVRGPSESWSPRARQAPLAPLNGGERSPKRQRIEPETTHGGPEAKNTSASTSFASSQGPPSARRPSFSQDRHPNGYIPPSIPHHPPPHHRYPHPLPQPPRPFPRRDSGGARDGGMEPDPIQQRIDEIVQQNMLQGSPPSKSNRRNPDRYRGDWGYDDPGRRRRSSGRRSMSIDEQQYHHQQQQLPPPPPPADDFKPPEPPSNSPPPERIDEGEGSEEGEL